MTPQSNEAVILWLLETAEQSLAAFIAAEPQTNRRYLADLYTFIRANSHRLALEGDTEDKFPDARNLYWDDPEGPLEQKCLDDAFALFTFIQAKCAKRRYDA